MAMMNLDEWELEMSRMLDMFANQALTSLGIINRRFDVLGRPFDEKFRQHFLKMSNQRLDSIFDRVLFSSGSFRLDATEKSMKSSNFTEKNVDRVQSVKDKKVDDGGGLIEIYDSDDEIDSTDDHDERNGTNESPKQSTNNDESPNDVHNDTIDLDYEIEIKPSVKGEPNVEDESETFELPFIEFDPSKENSSVCVDSQNEETSKAHQPSSSSNANGHQSKHGGAKRFNCKHCDYSSKWKRNLKYHQRIHANGKLIGIKADSKGLYHCRLCVRQFTDVGTLSKHMKSHKNDQYLYECGRCMRKRFERKEDNDSHEIQCKGRHYECHLCKVYVAINRNNMGMHMRTHSGEKPFRCMMCNKSFQQKVDLRRHLNNVHSHNRP